MKNLLKKVLFMLILDFIWISSNSKKYSQMVQDVQGKELNVKLIPAITAYVFMIIGYYIFVEPYSNNKNGVYYAFAFGALMYSIFNLTNLAIFTNYSTSTALIDSIWGGVLYATVFMLK